MKPVLANTSFIVACLDRSERNYAQKQSCQANFEHVLATL